MRPVRTADLRPGRRLRIPPYTGSDRAAGSRGLSLFELVVAMALFAMVATLGLQALSGTVQIGNRLGAVSAQVGAESRAVTLLRQDLSRMVGLRFHPPGGAGFGQSALSLSADGLQLSFSIAGQHDDVAAPISGASVIGASMTAGLQRVVWRLDPASGQLSRQIWPGLHPAHARQQAPATVWLTEVASLQLRSFSRQTGWVAGVRPEAGSLSSEPDSSQASSLVPTLDNLDGDQLLLPDYSSDRLPLALDLVLTRRNGDQLRLLEVLR